MPSALPLPAGAGQVRGGLRWRQVAGVRVGEWRRVWKGVAGVFWAVSGDGREGHRSLRGPVGVPAGKKGFRGWPVEVEPRAGSGAGARVSPWEDTHDEVNTALADD